MVTVKYFIAQKRNHRFRKGQKVWIGIEHAEHMRIFFRWRGKGRFTNGVISKESKSLGEIKEINVKKDFADRFLI